MAARFPSLRRSSHGFPLRVAREAFLSIVRTIHDLGDIGSPRLGEESFGIVGIGPSAREREYSRRFVMCAGSMF